MGGEDRYEEEPEGEFTDFVPAAFARSIEEAEKYRELLDEHDIPAIIGSAEHDEDEEPTPRPSRSFSRGVPVLVPEALLDEAGEVIADSEESDEFTVDDYDSGEDDEEEDDAELEEELDADADHPPDDDSDEGDVFDDGEGDEGV